MYDLSGDEDVDSYWNHSVRKVNIFNEEKSKAKVSFYIN